MFRGIAFLALAPYALGGEPDAKGLEFYEKKIRPALVEHCLRCHSADAATKNKLKGGLQLDSREAMIAGGDSGAAIKPGNPGDSFLLTTMRYSGEVHMPPAGKLDDQVISDFEKWIKMGAPAPKAEGAVKKQVGMSIEEGRKFWSYQPVKAPEQPKVKDTAWGVNGIDAFILADLEAKGLNPAKDADKATLIRRVYYDLTGLPPTPEQVDAFVRNNDPKAYENCVDELLKSPAFGDRWGRHWLDVARFAESTTLRGFIYKDSWRYRDYVINAFNDDMPYGQFIREQIAGDLLPAKDTNDRSRQLVATAFLMIGNTNFEEQDKKLLRMDMVDEQLDVITKGFLGQTVTCARCHDHKFDPIPTKDYYALAGILRNAKSLEHSNVSVWTTQPLPMAAEQEKLVQVAEAKIKAMKAKIAEAKKKPAKVVKGTIPLKDIPGIVVDDAAAKKVGDWKSSQHTDNYIGEGYCHDENKGKGEKTITFQPELPASGKYEVRFAYIPGESRSKKVPVTVFSADGEKEIDVDMSVAGPIEGRWISLGIYRFEKSGQSFVIVSNEDTKGHVTADCVTFIPADDAEAAAKADPTGVKALEMELKKLEAESPKRATTMAPLEEKAIEDCPVHIRGSVGNLGETAPRGVLSVAHYGKPVTFPKDASGRVELADWIASNDNPLTRRVYVNRAWHWLMGSGIVRSVDNFGTTGEKPTHPALLEYLAESFTDGSTKNLVRRIVLSRTYRQSSENPSAVKVDTENKLLARANRKRFDAEMLRDTMLAVSGTLSAERGGKTFPESLSADYNFKSTDTRRSVYQPVFRNSLPEIFEVFDFAEPSMVVGARNTSTVAPQALFMLNHPSVHKLAKQTAERLLKDEPSNDDARLQRAYQLILGRAPTEGEKVIALKAVSQTDGWAALVHALFASADFRTLN